LEFSSSVGFIHKESVTMHGHMIIKKKVLSGVKGNHTHFMLRVLWLFVPWRTHPQQNRQYHYKY